ncbi:MAG TPA: hypothetical protein VKM54_20625, partial [Myxococcota bacterium]|nr:hypothetical protein [Myxococcota bacterium]
PSVVSLVVDSGMGPHTFSFTLFRVASIDPIRIVTPADGTFINKSPATVTVIAPLGTPFVQVNAIAAKASSDGTTFTAQVPLQPGANNLQALAAPFSQQATAHVTFDATPPQITLLSPSGGASVDPTVLVSGLVSKNATVTVSTPSGPTVQAEVRFDAARSVQLFLPSFGSNSPVATEVTVYDFDVPNYPLVAGSNTLTIQATDPAGNMSSTTVTVIQQNSALQLVAPADGSTLSVAQTDVTLQALADSVIDAVYVAGQRLPGFDGLAVAAGTVVLPGVPLFPGTDDVRIVSHRASGTGQGLLDLTLVSTATNVATVAGTVTDAASGAPIDGASVTVTEGGTSFVVVTNPDGSFSASVVPGAITIAGTATGEAAASISVTPSTGQTATANLALPSAGIPGLPNQVAVLVPPPNTVTDWDLIAVVGTVENPASTVTVNGIAAQLVGNRFTAQHVPLTMGTNTLTVTATAPGATAVTAAVTIQRSNTPTLTVKIYSPPHGATVPGAGLVVRGFISAKSASVSVPGAGVVAATEGLFMLTDVTPSVGASSTLSAIAETNDYTQSAQDAVTLNVLSAQPALVLAADPLDGDVPFASTLTLFQAGATPFPIARIDFDTNGDGVLDVLATPTPTTAAQFATAGLFLPRVFVTTPDGVELSAPTQVNAHLPAQVLGSFAAGNPVDLAGAPDGSVYVLDGAAGTVTKFDLNGNVLSSFGSGQLSGPQALTFGPDGNLYVADTGNGRIVVFDLLGTVLKTIGSPASGVGFGPLASPEGVAVTNDAVIVSDTGNGRIAVFGLDGTPQVTYPLAGARGATWVRGFGAWIASPQAGLNALADRVFQTQGTVLAGIPSSMQPQAPIDVAEGTEGVFILDSSGPDVILFSPRLQPRRRVHLNIPSARAVLQSVRREVESFYIADGHQVQEISLPVPSPLPVVQALHDRLAAQDIEGALALIDPSQRDRFRAIYNEIAPDLPIEASYMLGFRVDLLREDEALVMIESQTDVGGQMVPEDYPVQLERAVDGSWQIFDY